MTDPIVVGATAADPVNAVLIWNSVRRWFVEHRFPIEYALYSTYDAQCRALLSGAIDIAWSAPMAHVQCLIRSGGGCRTLAMRDTDADNHTLIVAKRESGLESWEDLRGRRLALGVEVSSELHLIPVAQLRDQGLDPLTQCELVSLEPREYSDLKRWIDEPTIFEAVLTGEAEAGAIFEPWLPHLVRKHGLDPDDIVEVWRSKPYNHCAFTAGPGLDTRTANRFVELLLQMDPKIDYIADMMKREHLKRWEPANDSGWSDLRAAVEAAGLAGKLF